MSIIKTQKIVCTAILTATVAMGIMTGCSEQKTEERTVGGNVPVKSTNAPTVSDSGIF